MTDITDIKALKPQPLCFLVQQESRNGPDCYVECHDGYRNSQAVYSSQQMQDLLDRLEAERQRADELKQLRDSWRESAYSNTHRAEKAEAEIAALKGDQVPVADVQSVATAIMQTIDAETDKFHSAYTLSELRIAIVKTLTGVFTAPQKPVVLPPLRTRDDYESRLGNGDIGPYNHGHLEGWNAAIEAAGGIVKDGE